MATLLLNCVHYIAAVLSCCRYWFVRFHSLTFNKTDTCVVQSDARNLKKLPLHLGLLLLEDDISYTDIANLLLWSATMGITFITIYDRNGSVKSHKNHLERELEKQQQLMTDSECTKTEILIHCGMFKHNSKHKSSSQVNVFLLSLEDGRQSIVNTARTICKQVTSKVMKTSDISPNCVDLLFQESGYPDPDMIIRFGSVESLMGFMPWHIRLTEILSVESHVGINYKTFKSVLVSYGETKQRFGK